MTTSTQLVKVQIILPKDFPGVEDNFLILSQILQKDTVRSSQESFILANQKSPNLIPHIELTLSSSLSPQVILVLSDHSKKIIPFSSFSNPTQSHNSLPLNTIYPKIKDRLSYIDHIGIVIPGQQVDKLVFDRIVSDFSTTGAVYSYPTREDRCFFIIPSTQEEFKTKNYTLTVRRAPKFELVYDRSGSNYQLHFDIETDFSKEELEALFPSPIGNGLDGLDQYFRTLFIQSPWETLDLRLDLRYKSKKMNHWQRGEVLIKGRQPITPKSFQIP